MKTTTRSKPTHVLRGLCILATMTVAALGVVVVPPNSTPVTWAIGGPGATLATPSDPIHWAMTYELHGGEVFSTQTWTVSAIVPADGDYEFNWQYSGYHAFFSTDVFLATFGPGIGDTLVQHQQAGGGFNFNAGGPSYTFHGVHAGDTIGFQMGGSNFDSDDTLKGTLVLNQVIPANRIVFQKGDAVPSAEGATFTGFGVPAISDRGDIAFYGTWAARMGGVFANGVAIVKVNDVFEAGTVRSLKDPVVDENGRVAFLGKLFLGNVTPANDLVVFSNALSEGLAIVAQEGAQAPDAPAGALWKNFTSVALQGGGRGVLILGTLAVGGGGITPANDTGLWAQDNAGALHLVLQEGTTQIGGKTVKTFAALKTVYASPGQAHAFNHVAELVAKVTFTDGAQAVVHLDLPQGQPVFIK